MASVFITGGSGYMGRALSAELLRRGHRVRALVRAGSEQRAGPGCEVVTGDALDAASYRDGLAGCDTLVHLVGVPHPNPAKAAQFVAVDLASVRQAVAAAVYAGIRHFVYVSVAHPAPVMRAYIEARSLGEDAIRTAALDATILRPWYVLGPGRRWPALLLPIYRIMEMLARTREGARRLGLVTIQEMVAALAAAVENPSKGVRIVEVPGIREAARV